MKAFANLLLVLTAIGITNTAVSSGHRYPYVEHENMLLLLNGTRISYECEIPATNRGTVDAMCHDHEVIDMRTNKIIGKATDATADVDDHNGGLVGTGTTFFYLKNGSFVVRGRGTIQPLIYGSAPVNAGNPVTHIAGIFPEQGETNILAGLGTGRYKNATGTFTLLGALDLSRSDEGIATYHCVYAIDLDFTASARRNHWSR